MTFATSGLAAQAPAECAPVTAARGAAITFGHEGGSLRPRTVAIFADGAVRSGGDAATDSVASLAPAAVSALVRFARNEGFWTVRAPAARRPPANPDAARSFIEVRATCGVRRAEFVMGEPWPRAFEEFNALLSAVAASPGRP